MTGARSNPAARASRDVTYRLVLFVAGEEANSRLARTNLAEFCAEELAGRCEVREVDVFADVDEAVAHNILVTPTLVVEGPGPRRVLVGNLSDRRKVLGALGL